MQLCRLLDIQKWRGKGSRSWWAPEAAAGWLEAEVTASLSCSCLPSVRWLFHSGVPRQMCNNVYSLQICIPKQKQGRSKEPGAQAAAGEMVESLSTGPSVSFDWPLIAKESAVNFFLCESLIPSQDQLEVTKSFSICLLVKGWSEMIEERQDSRFGRARGTSGGVSSAEKWRTWWVIQLISSVPALPELGAGLFPALAVL